MIQNSQNSQKRFVIGDIHGEYEYMMEVLKASKIDYENDLLIQIGDIVDRGPKAFQCMDELLKFKHLILIKGNHDEAFDRYISTNYHPLIFHPSNGAEITITQWEKLPEIKKQEYISMIFQKQRYYYISDDNIMFVHAGFPRDEKLDDVDNSVFCWDRELIYEAMSCKGDQKLKTLYNFKEIFIGHTPTIYWGEYEPIYSGGVMNVDTGAGKGGPLTIMNIDSKQYWQSDMPLRNKEYYAQQKKDKSNCFQTEIETTNKS